MFELLTPDESLRMNVLESIISKGKQTFVEVGTALAEIRDSKYYRRGFKTFAEYCQSKWGFEKAHAHRLIEAASVVKTSPVGDKIKTERQARELSKVDPVNHVAVIEKAQAASEVKGKPMTAGDIKEAATEAVRKPAVEVSEEMKKARAEAEADSGKLWALKSAWKRVMKPDMEKFTPWAVGRLSAKQLNQMADCVIEATPADMLQRLLQRVQFEIERRGAPR